MGKMKQNPKYNVISMRVSDLHKAEIRIAAGGQSVSDFLAAAVREKIANDRQARIDEAVRGLR